MFTSMIIYSFYECINDELKLLCNNCLFRKQLMRYLYIVHLYLRVKFNYCFFLKKFIVVKRLFVIVLHNLHRNTYERNC